MTYTHPTYPISGPRSGTKNGTRIGAVFMGAILVAIALPSTAQAGDIKHKSTVAQLPPGMEAFEAHFKYDARTDPEKTYDRFRRIAARECNVDDSYRAPALHRAAKICQRDLMDQVIDKSANLQLAALHNGEAIPNMGYTRFVEVRPVDRTVVLSAVEGMPAKSADCTDKQADRKSGH